MTIKELVKVAVELNRVLGLEPPINLMLNKANLIETIKQVIQLVVADDEFSKRTTEILQEIDTGKKFNPYPEKDCAKTTLADEDRIRAGRLREQV